MAEQISEFQIKLTSDISKASREIKQLEKDIKKLQNEISKPSKNPSIKSIEDGAKKATNQIDVLTKKQDILRKQLSNKGKLSDSDKTELKRLSIQNQLLGIKNRIHNIEQAALAKKQKQQALDEKQAELAEKQADQQKRISAEKDRQARIQARVPEMTEKFLGADKATLLGNKYTDLSARFSQAVNVGDYERANRLALQMLSVQGQIYSLREKEAREVEKVADAEKSVNEESQKSFEILTKVKSVASNIGGVLKSLGGKAIAKITEPFKRMQKSIKTLLSSIGRIAFYRAIRSGIKAVTQGFSEGIKHLYAWSEAFNTKFAPAMDQYKTQMTYLHNGFAAMFSPLIEWVIPNVLTPLTDAMVEFFNLVQQGFATLVGHDYWYKAQKSMTKFGEATKKANIQLAKFDELNNLTETGSGSDEDASGMFTLEKVSADFGKGFFAEIRDEIKNGDWYGIGNTIADRLNEGIGNFNARGLASTIASKINNAINLALGFSENFNFDQLGTKIGGFIDQAIKDVKWDKLGSASGNLVGGLVTMILSAIEEIDLAKAVDAFFDFWENLFGSLGSRLFEDNGYHVKMLALKLAEFVIAVIHNALSFFRKAMKGANLFKDPSNALFAKSLGLSEDSFNQMADTNEYMAYQAILNPVRKAEEELKRSHEAWLADQSKTTENSVTKLGSNVVEIFRNTGANSVRAYQSANWGTTVPTDKIKAEVATSGIDYKYREQATKALSAYTAVQWASGGTVSADGIKNALIQAGVPASMAMQASESLASFINTLNGGKSSVTNAFNNMTSGYDATGVGRNIGSRIVSGMNSVLVSSPIASVGGGNSNYRITISKNAKGGYLFANGGFASGLSQGTMYVAGEVPGQAEMVGQINGRTGVASGFEITGIRDAVISTGENEAQLLQTLISVLERKNLVISPSAQLGRVMAQSNRLYSGVTG